MRLKEHLIVPLMVTSMLVAMLSSNVGCRLRSSACKPELMVQTGHSFSVLSVAFSPDGKTLAAASDDDTIKLWDISTRKELRSLNGHSDSVCSIAFSADGKSLVSGGLDTTIKLWDISTGKELRSLAGHSGGVTSVAISADGKTLASGSYDRTIKFWDISTGKELRSLTKHSDSVTSVAFSPDSKTLASGSHDRTIKLWEVSTGKELRSLTGHSDWVTSIAFSPDSKTVASGSRDKTIKLWNTASGKELCTLAGHYDVVSSVVFSSDGKTLASGSGYVLLYPECSHDDTIKLWDISTGKESRSIAGHSDAVNSVAFSADGKTLASGSGDKTIKLWDISDGKELCSLTGHSHWVNSVAFSPDIKILALGSGDGTVKLWDISTGKGLRSLACHTDAVNSVVFSPDGKILASASNDKTIKLWSVSTGKELRCIAGHSGVVNSVAFSTDGKTLASASDDETIKLWNIFSGKELHSLVHHSDAVYSVAFSPNGKILASGSGDKTIKLWNSSDGKELRSLTGHTDAINSVVFSADGKTLASGSDDNTIILWDISDGKELRSLAGHSDAVFSVAFSPNGEELASASDDTTIKLWNIANGRELRSLAKHSSLVKSVAFSTDGKFLASGSRDTMIKLWNDRTGQEIASLCAFGKDDWAVVDSEGRFDASNLDEITSLAWVLPNDPMRAYPPEIFMRQYFEPNLLVRLMKGEPLSKLESIDTLSRVQPEVTITGITPQKDRDDLVDVTVTYKSMRRMQPGRGELRSGVYDLRLFRDGQLATYSPADQSFSSASSPDLSHGSDELQSNTFTVRLPHNGAQEYLFTAYAFNSEQVKSQTTSKTFTPKMALPKMKGRAYIIGFGVNDYDDETIRDLQCAAADARAYGNNFKTALENSGRYNNVVFIPLISDKSEETAASTDKLPATKRCLKSVLDVLARRASTDERTAVVLNRLGVTKTTPEDFVFIAVSSHGETYQPVKDANRIAAKTEQNEFYILPQETKLRQGTHYKASLDDTAISSADLTDWLVDVEADDIVMILDCCYSGAVVGQDFKPGPMDSRGLGQLAYYKRMRLLSASQADNTALEFARLGHGLLTHVLLTEGLGERMADVAPKDGAISLKEWLEFAVAEVPRLDASSNSNGFRSLDGKSTENNLSRGTKEVTIYDNGKQVDICKQLQVPKLFDFVKKRDFIIVGRRHTDDSVH